ncbi:hypothetical protein [Actinomycetospora sp. CA-053990]|uniref:hypothetical protein n=1 Tax=Actinomycetospora sp. CA-053990 TaxID=3239891 RepID=UPI003D94C083
MDLLIDLPCRRLRLVLDEGSDRVALLAELRSRRGADPPRCLADPGRPCGPGRPCAFSSRRDRAPRRPPESDPQRTRCSLLLCVGTPRSR